MPYVSNAQRRKFHAMEARGEISPATVKEFDRASKGKKLPEKVKKAYLEGGADALAALGLKAAAEELRLKIPERTFHGYDAAKKAESERAHKRADCEPQDANELKALLDALSAPVSPNTQLSTKDPLDRTTAWGAPSNLAGGDTASRLSDMGQNNGFGGI